jgi:2-polyprenyl-6-hydroxyphenyl methylase/3-demethylubiquinone-9 3-methyltransferase
MPDPTPTQTPRTVDARDVAHFSRLSAQWWNARGPWATLHRFNDVRLAYICRRTAEHFGVDPGRLAAAQPLRMLDVGCGGGILAEPLAQRGASVVGIDPSRDNIAIARAHAAQSGVSVDYRAMTLEALAPTREAFDVVLAMEVVEHVADAGLFLDLAAAVVKPGGLLFVGTLNRTIRSFVFAIVGAEWVLGWIPRGTHRWRKFVRPAELATALGRNGLRIREKTGVAYNPFANRFRLTRSVSASYMVVAEKGG